MTDIQHVSHITIHDGEDIVTVLVVDMDVPSGKTLNVSWTNTKLTADQLKRLGEQLEGRGQE